MSLASCSVTVALSAFMLLGTLSLSQQMRREIGRAGKEFVVVQQAMPMGACRLSERSCTAHGVRVSLREFERLSRAVENGRVALIAVWRSDLRSAARVNNVTVVGVRDRWMELEPIDLEEGRGFSVAEEVRQVKAALVGRSMVDSLFHGVVPASVRIGGATFPVVGVVSSGPTARVDVNRSVVVPFGAVRAKGAAAAAMVVLIAEVGAGVSTGASIYDALSVLKRGNVSVFRALSLTTSSQLLGEVGSIQETLERGTIVFSAMLTAVTLITSVALLVSIANSSRHPIGVCRALGAPRFAIALEGGVLGASIGTCGSLFGAAAALVAGTAAGILADMDGRIVSGALLQATMPVLCCCALVGAATFFRVSRQSISGLLA